MNDCKRYLLVKTLFELSAEAKLTPQVQLAFWSRERGHGKCQSSWKEGRMVTVAVYGASFVLPWTPRVLGTQRRQI